MKKISRLTFSSIALLLCGYLSLSAQEFTNVNIKQLETNVNLEYSIEGEQLGQTFSVVPLFSTDGGHSFMNMKSVSGYVGSSVTGGKNQVIIWDVLKDLPALQGDIVFKINGNTKSSKPIEDDFSKVNFKLVSLHKTGQNQLELVLSITNNDATRDLKIINGLVTITDFKKQKYDAQRGKLGEVIGGQRHSTPTRTLKTNETVVASFTFDRIPADIERVMRLDVGAELITMSDFGIDDLKVGRLQYRDVPVSEKPTGAMTIDISKSFEATTTASLNVQKPKPTEAADTKAPVVTVTSPDGVTLTGSESTRGRPYAQSSTGLDDKRLRALASGEEFATTDKSIVVKGKATDESGIYEVKINGVDAKVNSDGSYEANVLLSIGKNEIVIRAMDLKQNSVEKKFFVLRKGEQGQVTKGETEELDIIFDEQKKQPQYYALIMGANDYQDDNVSDLAQPINDATKLYEVLVSKYTFNPDNVAFIKNPTRQQMIDVLDYFARSMTKNDNLLVFYAGHGFWDKETDFGYWIPVDSKATTTSNWMANSQIRDYVAAMKTKHTLLIADACFGGSIFRDRKAFEEGSNPKNKSFDSPSRKAMTSGNLTEVPDRSVFLEYLVKRLSENTRDYISAEEIFGSMKDAVMNSSPVTPMYGEIKDAGDQGGDFIFVRK